MAGRVKTRLTPPLSPAQASALYEAFLEDAVTQLERVFGGMSTVGLYFSCVGLAEFAGISRLLSGGPWHAFEQEQVGGLGNRILRSIQKTGAEEVLVLGSDAPSLPDKSLGLAFDALEHADAVFGPSDDGGYYLVGVKRPFPGLLFDDALPWSQPTLLEVTKRMAMESKLRLSLLESGYDVDDLATIFRLREDLRRSPQIVATATRKILRSLPAF